MQAIIQGGAKTGPLNFVLWNICNVPHKRTRNVEDMLQRM